MLCSTDFVLDELQDIQHDVLLEHGLIVETLESASIMRPPFPAIAPIGKIALIDQGPNPKLVS